MQLETMIIFGVLAILGIGVLLFLGFLLKRIRDEKISQLLKGLEEIKPPNECSLNKPDIRKMREYNDNILNGEE